MPINYLQMLLDLMEERQKWLNQRDEAIREITRLSKLIRATRNVVRFSGPNCAEKQNDPAFTGPLRAPSLF